MNILPLATRAQIIGLLVEGNSLRAAARLSQCSLNTVTKLLRDVGAACAEYQDRHLRNLSCKNVQCDEIWSFIGAKDKNATPEQKAAGMGDIWTWTAIDADTKLCAGWMVGPRNPAAAVEFMQDLAPRFAHRIQLTTDGYRPYVKAVEGAFGNDIDYARLVKIYATYPFARASRPERRYETGECCGAEKHAVCGNPDADKISTSFVERQNLTMRMSMRRFTRLTNGFSKKVENHAHAVALHFMHYNFGRMHKTLKTTPAVAAGVAKAPWTMEQIAALVKTEAPAKRGSYKPRHQAEAISN